MLLLNLVNFLTCFFWFVLLAFLINSNNILHLLLYTELVWVLLYTLSCYLGSINDDLNLISLTFFFLALAGLEFCVGFLMVILLRNFKKLIETDAEKSVFNFTKKQITATTHYNQLHYLS